MKLLLHLLTSLHGPKRHLVRCKDMSGVEGQRPTRKRTLNLVEIDPGCVKTHLGI